jgi:hypothetical protein
MAEHTIPPGWVPERERATWRPSEPTLLRLQEFLDRNRRLDLAATPMVLDLLAGAPHHRVNIFLRCCFGNVGVGFCDTSTSDGDFDDYHGRIHIWDRETGAYYYEPYGLMLRRLVEQSVPDLAVTYPRTMVQFLFVSKPIVSGRWRIELRPVQKAPSAMYQFTNHDSIYCEQVKPLRERGVESLSVCYNGYDDDGSIGDMVLHVDKSHPGYVEGGERLSEDEQKAVNAVLWDLLQGQDAGPMFHNTNAGSQGRVTIDLRAGTSTREHYSSGYCHHKEQIVYVPVGDFPTDIPVSVDDFMD